MQLLPLLKKCSSCKQFLDIALFTSKKSGKIRRECNPCKAEVTRKYRNTHKDKVRDYNKVWNLRNPGYQASRPPECKDRRRIADRERVRKNREKFNERRRATRNGKEEYKRNKFRREVLRKAAIHSNQKEQIKNFYSQRGYLIVDHIVPIISEKVCGLHVLENLQYLTPLENSFKGNSFDGTLENIVWKHRVF